MVVGIIIINNQKGMRRHAGDMDEDNLTDEQVFLDALEPILMCQEERLVRKV